MGEVIRFPTPEARRARLGIRQQPPPETVAGVRWERLRPGGVEHRILIEWPKHDRETVLEAACGMTGRRQVEIGTVRKCERCRARGWE